jgi:hypothetical protein
VPGKQIRGRYYCNGHGPECHEAELSVTPEIVWYPPGAYAVGYVPLAITGTLIVRFTM